MTRLEDLKLTDEPIGNDVDYDKMPRSDPHYDRMHEGFDDPACPNPPGVAGDYGAGLDVAPSTRVH